MTPSRYHATPIHASRFGIFVRGSPSDRIGWQLTRATTMKERWKTFANGNYEASNHGNVRRKTPGRATWPGRPMALSVMKIG